MIVANLKSPELALYAGLNKYFGEAFDIAKRLALIFLRTANTRSTATLAIT